MDHNSVYKSITHQQQLTSPAAHNSVHHNFNSNFNSQNCDENPLANSVNNIYSSSVLPQSHQQNEGILQSYIETGIGWSTNCFKNTDRHLPEQGTFIRSKSLDDLNSLTFQEDHHHHHHLHLHHHHLSQHHNQFQNQVNNSTIREDHHINHHHPHPNHRHAPNENRIFNQPMISSSNCDIEDVLQKISRLEM